MSFNADDILLPLAITVIIDSKVRDPELKSYLAQAHGLLELFDIKPQSDEQLIDWFKSREDTLTQDLKSKRRNTIVLRALTKFTELRHIENMFDAMVSISVSDNEFVHTESDLIKSAASLWGFERPPIKVDRPKAVSKAASKAISKSEVD